MKSDAFIQKNRKKRRKKLKSGVSNSKTSSSANKNVRLSLK